MDHMDSIRKEVLALISASEKVQGLVAQGAELTADEQELIRMCSSELLRTALQQSGPPYSEEQTDGGQYGFYSPGQSQGT